MGIVAVLCPKTSRHISTGIELDRAAFEAFPISRQSVDCWACGGQHSWSRRWATLIACDDPTVRRAGTPIPETVVLNQPGHVRRLATSWVSAAKRGYRPREAG